MSTHLPLNGTNHVFHGTGPPLPCNCSWCLDPRHLTAHYSSACRGITIPEAHGAGLPPHSTVPQCCIVARSRHQQLFHGLHEKGPTPRVQKRSLAPDSANISIKRRKRTSNIRLASDTMAGPMVILESMGIPYGTISLFMLLFGEAFCGTNNPGGGPGLASDEGTEPHATHPPRCRRRNCHLLPQFYHPPHPQMRWSPSQSPPQAPQEGGLQPGPTGRGTEGHLRHPL